MTRYQPFHDLPASQYEALKADIELRGQVLPVVVDEAGQTIDGHQRRRACAELHLECQTVTVAGLTEEEKEALAIALNAFRRHLAGVERSKAITRLAHLGMSQRRIAEAVGVGVATVNRDIAKSGVPDGTPEPPPGVDPDTGEITASSGNGQSTGSAVDAAVPGDDEKGTAPTPSPAPKPAPRVKGKDGKSYPAAVPKPPKDPVLVHQADLSAHRKHVADWLAFDRHEQVIEAMNAEQRADYRSFVHSVWTHASQTLDLLDNPTRLKAVK